MKATKYTIATLIMIAFALTGCGETQSSAIASKHNQICEAAGRNPSNCPDDLDISGLVMFCKLVSTSFYDTEDCNTKMDAYLACNAERSWTCLEGGDLPVPLQPDTCSEAVTAPFVLPNGECVNPSKVSSN